MVSTLVSVSLLVPFLSAAFFEGRPKKSRLARDIPPVVGSK